VTPAPKGSLVGNRHTAQRYARILRELGVRASVAERWEGDRCDLLVALHARKSARSILDFSRAHPLAPLIVVLTGTDLYEDLGVVPEVSRSLDLATRIVVLQPEALRRLEPRWREKAAVVYQSAQRASSLDRDADEATESREADRDGGDGGDHGGAGGDGAGPASRAASARPLEGVFEIASVGHLRDVKDPFLAAAAVRLLPPESQVRVSHVGAVLDRSLEERTRRESATNPRWRWLGERTHAATLHVIARARAFLQTSHSEGGSSALAEAVVAHKPIVCTRIDAAVGMLGADHPGFFEVGDARGLAERIARLESDESWRALLVKRSEELAPRFAPERELEAWRALLADVGLGGGRPRFTLTRVGRHDTRGELADAVRAGLTSAPKYLPCRFFYDEVGSRLFERICELPEYYLTRAEDEILERHARDLVDLVPAGAEIVELGSGSSVKTQRILAAVIARDGRAIYRPIDISPPALEAAGRDLTRRFPVLRVDAIAGEYRAGLRALPGTGRPPRLYLWLGSNVGNFDRAAAVEFLRDLLPSVDFLDRVAIGFDRRKDKAVLEAAYDDAQGVTAEFNRNLLARLVRELEADLDPKTFRHVAEYDQVEGRVEMFLESTRDQRVEFRSMGLDVPFALGERVHTEDSYKYSDAEIDALAEESGYRVDRRFHDAAGRFTVAVFAPRELR